MPLEPGVIAHRRHGKPLWAEYLTKQPKQNRKQRNQPASTPTAPPRDRRNPSFFFCPSLSQTSAVGKVSSVKLFHKLSKNTASRKPTKTSSLQARNYQTTSAVSKTLPGFQNSKQNSKSTSKVESTSAIFFPASALWPVWPGQSTVSVGRKLYRSI